MSVSYECGVLSGSGLCYELIPRREKSYRVSFTEYDQVQQQPSTATMSR